MNEQAQQLLVGLIQKASEGIDSAVAFSQAQIPDVIQQLMTWNFVESAIYFTISLLSIWPISVFIRKNMTKRRHTDTNNRYTTTVETLIWDDRGNSHVGCIVFGAIVVVWAILFCLLFQFTWLKIWIAPKLYLIEYAASLVK